MDPAGCVDFVYEMNSAQLHRGPDAASVHAAKGWAVGNTRLAILGLGEPGAQPYHSADGQVTIVYNGEIYNFRDLARRLNIDPQGACDGAILPALYQALGLGMFQRLRGMWAMAIIDHRDGSLTLARDHLGIKPLYYSGHNHEFRFASELTTLVPHLASMTIDRTAIEHYLRFGSMARGQSPFAEIRSLPEGSWLRMHPDRDPETGSFQFQFDSRGASGQQLRQLLLDTIESHLESDVPAALLLSSGLDSSILAWATAERDRHLTCITVDLPGMVSERDVAEETARRYGHRWEVLSTQLNSEDVRRFFQHMQKPTIDGLNTFLVTQAVAGLGLKVALSGTGGDELVGGYPQFRALRYLRALNMIDRLALNGPASRAMALVPASVGRREKLMTLIAKYGARDAYALSALYREVWSVASLVSAGVRPTVCAPPSLGLKGARSDAAMSNAEYDLYLQPMLLPDADAFSMANSVELRVPFVDAQLREVLVGRQLLLPNKRALAAVTGDAYLAGLTRRRKLPFRVPMTEWMANGPLAPLVAAVVHSEALAEIFPETNAERLVAVARTSGRWSQLWSLAVLAGWFEQVRCLGGPSMRMGTVGN